MSTSTEVGFAPQHSGGSCSGPTTWVVAGEFAGVSAIEQVLCYRLYLGGVALAQSGRRPVRLTDLPCRWGSWRSL